MILFHSSWRAFHNYSVFGFLALEHSPRVFHTFSIGLRSGLWGGQSITVTFSALRKFMTTIALWHGALSCMNMGGYLVEFLSTGKTWSFTSCAMVKMVKKDWFKTAADAAASREMSIQLGKPISRKTVSRRLVEQQLLARAPVVKPLISSKNKKCRLDFANEHVLWSQEKWQRCISMMNLSFR